MSKFKVYQWRGVSSLSLALEIDGRKRDIEFPTGTERPKVNARYETSDEVIQEKIEATNLFQDGAIKIVREYEIPTLGAAVKSDAPAVEKKPEVKTPEAKKNTPAKGAYPSVTNYQQAAAKLHEKFAVPMEQLQDPDSIMSEAAKYGATFPNLIS
jgi:hypothetical protein